MKKKSNREEILEKKILLPLIQLMQKDFDDALSFDKIR